ncbi:hypothetical protein V8F33_010473 [Rhypophila sp. PSN 637]
MSVVNPVKEMGLLREIKETIDELQILGDIFKDELKVLTLAVDKGVLVAVGKRPENTPTAWKELISLVNSRWEEVQEMTRDTTRASQSVSLAKPRNRTGSVSQLIIANCMSTQLNDLIDLKQKFSNILEARWSRTMAEEASRQAEETAKQGTTLMVFTSVTIVFLPLSFMAAFFALDVAQFPRNEANQLDLGTVLQYIFLISVVVVAPVLFIAFDVTRLGALRQATKAKIHDSWNKRSSQLPSQKTRTVSIPKTPRTGLTRNSRTVTDSSLNSFSSPSPAFVVCVLLGLDFLQATTVSTAWNSAISLFNQERLASMPPAALAVDIAERVKILFASTMFSLHQEKIDAGWMDWTSDSSSGSGI